jgi:cysteine protease ATG4
MSSLITGSSDDKDGSANIDNNSSSSSSNNPIEKFKRYFNVDDLIAKLQKQRASSSKKVSTISSLYGKMYDTSNEKGERDFLADFRSHIWITYRNNFHALVPSPPTFPLTSDSGWGCMIRSGQMMLAEFLLRRKLGRDWRLDEPVSGSRNRSYSIAHKDILLQFVDAPNVKCDFSIHRIVQVGLQYGKRPGDWYGPEAISIVLRDLVNSHPHLNVEVYVASSGVVVKKDVLNLVAGNNNYNGGNNTKSDDNVNNNAKKLSKDSGAINQNSKHEWSSDLFLIIPCSILGRGSSLKINEKFINALCKIIDLPQSVGFIGGKPRHSVYFNGRCGDDIFYMDPHRVQNTVDYGARFPTLEELLSYHSPNPRRMNAKEIDASLALGFYIHNEDEFNHFCMEIEEIGKNTPMFFGVVDVNPMDTLSVDLMDSSGSNGKSSPTSVDEDDDEWDLL